MSQGCAGISLSVEEEGFCAGDLSQGAVIHARHWGGAGGSRGGVQHRGLKWEQEKPRVAGVQ